jgi:hypothetical protein
MIADQEMGYFQFSILAIWPFIAGPCHVKAAGQLPVQRVELNAGRETNQVYPR